MDNRDIYIKRMEAAVLQAGTALGKLKAEVAELRTKDSALSKLLLESATKDIVMNKLKDNYATLKKENEELKRKISSLSVTQQTDSISVPKVVRTQEVTSTVMKAIAKVAPLSPLKAVTAISKATERATTLMLDNGQKKSPTKKSLNIVPKSIKNDTKSSILSSWSGGEGLMGGDEEHDEEEGDEKYQEEEGFKIVLPMQDSHSVKSRWKTSVGVAVGRGKPFAESPSVSNISRNDDTDLKLDSSAKLFSDPTVCEDDDDDDDNAIPVTTDGLSAMAYSDVPKERKKSQKKLEQQQGWEKHFTACCHSVQKFMNKEFEINPNTGVVVCLEDRKELLPRDTIQLLLANASGNNVHIIAHSLKKFSCDILSKFFIDHLAHISYDAKWILWKNEFDNKYPVGNDIHKQSNVQSLKEVTNNGADKYLGKDTNLRSISAELIPAEFVNQIDILVSIVVSLITGGQSGYATGRLLVFIFYLILYVHSPSFTYLNCLDSRMLLFFIYKIEDLFEEFRSDTLILFLNIV
jgi:hypothetical protein